MSSAAPSLFAFAAVGCTVVGSVLLVRDRGPGILVLSIAIALTFAAFGFSAADALRAAQP